MVGWILGALVATPASGAKLNEVEVARAPSRFPPVRVDLGVAVREGLAPAFVGRLGFQLARSERWRLDANAAFLGPRMLYVPGPQRSFFAIEGAADALYVVNRLFSAGPSAGYAYRLYRQQGRLIDDSGTPVVGVRGDVTLVNARTWALVVVARGLFDLDTTRLVLEDQSVVDVVPLEGQLTLHLDVGHGRIP